MLTKFSAMPTVPFQISTAPPVRVGARQVAAAVMASVGGAGAGLGVVAVVGEADHDLDGLARVVAGEPVGGAGADGVGVQGGAVGWRIAASCR